MTGGDKTINEILALALKISKAPEETLSHLGKESAKMILNEAVCTRIFGMKKQWMNDSFYIWTGPGSPDSVEVIKGYEPRTPLYCDDLNLCAKVEEELEAKGLTTDYTTKLDGLVDPDVYPYVYSMLHAPAPVRVLAALLAVEEAGLVPEDTSPPPPSPEEDQSNGLEGFFDIMREG